MSTEHARQPTTSSRLRELSQWMLGGGLAVGLGAFAILQLSQDKIQNARLNFGPDEYAGTVTACWVFTAIGLGAAAVGAILLHLNPKGGAMAKVQLVEEPAKTSSIEERLAKVQSMLDGGIISDDEYQRQRKRILDQT